MFIKCMPYKKQAEKKSNFWLIFLYMQEPVALEMQHYNTLKH